MGEHDTRGTVPPVTGEPPSAPDACCKVARVTDAYGVAGVDVELRRRHADGATLHELAAYVDERLAAATLRAAGVDLDADPGTVAAALRGDQGVPAETRENVGEMAAGTFDADRLRTDFVSHETVRRHLNEHLDVSTSRGGIESEADLQEALDAYQRQYRESVSSALARAGERGLIDGGDFRVFSTQLECGNCGRTYRLRELLTAGGCDCDGE
jgi:hypothetical protein